MNTEPKESVDRNLADRVSRGAAAAVMTATLAAGFEPGEVVAATALTLGAGELSGGFGLSGTRQSAGSRGAAPRASRPWPAPATRRGG